MAKNEVYANLSGLKEIRRGLIKSDKDNSKEIRKAFKQTAEIAASDARSRVPVLSGNAKRSIKSGSSGANAVIRAGAKRGSDRRKAPYFGWLDFGGTIQPKGMKIQRAVIKSSDGLWNGRYIYPSMKNNVEKAVNFLNTRISEIINKNIENGA